jgi:uncharacterized protein YjbJ (UPF0337 family)
MSWDDLAANWAQIAGALRQRWSKLTNTDLDDIAGSREHLLGRLQALYGLNAERAEAEVRDWERHQEPIVPAWSAPAAPAMVGAPPAI